MYNFELSRPLPFFILLSGHQCWLILPPSLLSPSFSSFLPFYQVQRRSKICRYLHQEEEHDKQARRGVELSASSKPRETLHMWNDLEGFLRSWWL